MSNLKITMMKLKRIIQMLSDHRSLNDICHEVHSSKRTVSEYKKLADGTQLSYKELLLMEDSELEKLLQPPKDLPPADPRKAELDALMPEIKKRLEQRYANVQSVYENYYKVTCPNGYGYTQFNKHVKAFIEANNYSFHTPHNAGEELQIDFAGDCLYLTDPKSQETTKVVVLVCVMPYSELIFLMALPNATTEWFFDGLNKCLEYLGALPIIAKSDNMKQWVSKSDRYSPTMSEASQEWANYYGIGITACRVRHPRDKGPVESAVNQAYRYVYSRIQEDTFATIDKLNLRLWELLDEYNSKPYKGSTRWDIFNNEEKPAMEPLPNIMYRFRYRKTVKLGPSYHVCVGKERHFYSVPHIYVSQKVTVMWDVRYVEVYSGNELVCTHERRFEICGYTTKEEHMPESHKAWTRIRELNAAAYMEKAILLGPSITWMINTLLTKAQFPQQAYGKCQAVMSLIKKFGRDRVERACEMMKTETSIASLVNLNNILNHNRDSVDKDVPMLTPNSDVRGASYYQEVNTRKEEH